MVGNAVLRLSNCVGVTDTSMDNDNSSNSSNGTMMTTNMVCENEPVDIAVTLSLMIGIFMVSVMYGCPACIKDKYVPLTNIFV